MNNLNILSARPVYLRTLQLAHQVAEKTKTGNNQYFNFAEKFANNPTFFQRIRYSPTNANSTISNKATPITLSPRSKQTFFKSQESASKTHLNFARAFAALHAGKSEKNQNTHSQYKVEFTETVTKTESLAQKKTIIPLPHPSTKPALPSRNLKPTLLTSPKAQSTPQPTAAPTSLVAKQILNIPSAPINVGLRILTSTEQPEKEQSIVPSPLQQKNVVKIETTAEKKLKGILKPWFKPKEETVKEARINFQTVKKEIDAKTQKVTFKEGKTYSVPARAKDLITANDEMIKSAKDDRASTQNSRGHKLRFIDEEISSQEKIAQCTMLSTKDKTLYNNVQNKFFKKDFNTMKSLLEAIDKNWEALEAAAEKHDGSSGVEQFRNDIEEIRGIFDILQAKSEEERYQALTVLSGNREIQTSMQAALYRLSFSANGKEIPSDFSKEERTALRTIEDELYTFERAIRKDETNLIAKARKNGCLNQFEADIKKVKELVKNLKVQRTEEEKFEHLNSPEVKKLAQRLCYTTKGEEIPVERSKEEIAKLLAIASEIEKQNKRIQDDYYTLLAKAGRERRADDFSSFITTLEQLANELKSAKTEQEKSNIIAKKQTDCTELLTNAASY